MGILSTKHGYQVKVHGNARQLEHRLHRWTVGSNLAGNPDESDRRKVRPRVRMDWSITLAYVNVCRTVSQSEIAGDAQRRGVGDRLAHLDVAVTTGQGTIQGTEGRSWVVVQKNVHQPIEPPPPA